MPAQELAKTILANSSNLKAYYKFTAGATTTDSSGNSNTLTNVNTATEATGVFDGGIDLEATSSQYLYAADSASLDITGNLTISGWFKFESVGADNTLVCKYRHDNNQRAYALIFETNKLSLYISADGTAVTTRSVTWTPSAGTWYFITAVYTAAAGTYTLYINGAFTGLQGSLPTSIYNSSERLAIGAYSTTGTPAGFFDGVIDDIAIFSTALSADQIKELYEGRIYGELRPNQFGTTKILCHFNSNLTDYSGNNIHGTGTNAAYAVGKFGNCLDLNGSSAYVGFGDNTSTDLATNYTVSLWMKIDSIPGASTYGIAVWKGAAASESTAGYMLRVGNTDDVQWFHMNSNYYGIDVETAATTGVWKHYAITWNGTTQSGYVNGALVASANHAAGPGNSGEELRLGATNIPNRYFDGKIEEFFISSTALTANQIRQIYAYQKGLLGRYA